MNEWWGEKRTLHENTYLLFFSWSCFCTSWFDSKKVTVRISKSIILISCLKISRKKSFCARKKLNEIELKWKEKHERRERKKTFTLIERTTTYFRVNFHYFIPQKHDVLKLLKMPCKKAFPPHESICSISSSHLPYIFFFFIVRKTFQQWWF